LQRLHDRVDDLWIRRQDTNTSSACKGSPRGYLGKGSLCEAALSRNNPLADGSTMKMAIFRIKELGVGSLECTNGVGR
jgi:hypothetical protein